MIEPFPEFWNTSGVTNCVAFPFDREVCNAVVLYGINTPNTVVCFGLFMVEIPFFKIVDNVALTNNSAAWIIQFDWEPSWILTDLLKSKLFLKYFINIHHPKIYV